LFNRYYLGGGMKRQLAAFFAGVGLSVLVGFGAYGARNRRGIAERGRELGRRGAARGRQFARRGREIVNFGRVFAEGVRQNGVDLNQASIEQLLSLGLDRSIADRIVENRPYRSRLELVSRVMLPNDVYNSIKDRVSIARSREPVKVAS